MPLILLWGFSNDVRPKLVPLSVCEILAMLMCKPGQAGGLNTGAECAIYDFAYECWGIVGH